MNIHIGRYTSALLLIATGVALVLDQTSDTSYLRLLIEWWPMLLVMLGIEVIVLSLIYRNRDGGAKLRFSGGSIFGAVLITMVVMLLTGFGSGKVELTSWRFWEHAWQRYERPVERITLGDETTMIRIFNKNGDIVLRSGEVEQVEIESVVLYSNLLSEETSRAIREESTLQITEGESLEIRAQGKRYRQFFWQREARMNVTITVPADYELDYQLELSNGDVSVSQLQSAEQIRVRTSNGDIEMSRITGDTNVLTRNGDILLTDMDGKAILDTRNGDIKIESITSAVEAVTNNGDVLVTNAAEAVSIRTSNGDVVVRSDSIDGDWKIVTKNGDILLSVPQQGDYRIRGEGDIHTTIPWLERKRKKVEGQIGNGTFMVDVETKNGDLIIEYLTK